MACRVYIPGTTGWLYRRPDTVFVTVLGWYGSLALVGGVHVCNTSESPSHFVSQRLRYRTAIQPSYNPKITADGVDVSRNPRTQAAFRLYLQQLALPRKACMVSSSTTLARSLALFSRTDYARERDVSPRIPNTQGDLFRAGSRGGLGGRGRGRRWQYKEFIYTNTRYEDTVRHWLRRPRTAYLQRPVSTAADRHDLKLGMPVRNWMGPLPVRK